MTSFRRRESLMESTPMKGLLVFSLAIVGAVAVALRVAAWARAQQAAAAVSLPVP